MTIVTQSLAEEVDRRINRGLKTIPEITNSIIDETTPVELFALLEGRLRRVVYVEVRTLIRDSHGRVGVDAPIRDAAEDDPRLEEPMINVPGHGIVRCAALDHEMLTELSKYHTKLAGAYKNRAVFFRGLADRLKKSGLECLGDLMAVEELGQVARAA